MTARVTTLKGPDAGAYYVDGPGGYYLDGDEPPGQWLGRGADALGLTGDVADGDFLSLMDGRDPTGRLLGTSHHERTVRGFDVTCSAPKSVSVLWAVGDDETRRNVLAAHDAAVDAVLGWIEDHAHCRFRVDGEIWTVDARGIIAAAFRQHTSRAHDPQLHTHLVIANRVMAPDGRWLALDARTLKHDQRTISALYAAGLRAELTDRLGVRWGPVEHGQAEIADAPSEVLDLFSRRTGQMQRRFDDKLERFATDLGRPPTPRERWQLEREAAIDSRPSKTSIDAAEQHAHWSDEIAALGVTPDDYLATVTGQVTPVELDEAIDAPVVRAAVSALGDTQSTWRPAELTREIAAAMPTDLGATAQQMIERAEALASQDCDAVCVDISRPVPDGVSLRRDGRPVTEGALDRVLTTRAILDQEAHVLDTTQRWADESGDDAHDVATDDDLTAVQRHAAGAVAGERRLVLVVGPAGTGKTTAMRPAVAHLQEQGRHCFGVAPSAAAAEVLAVDTGLDCDTLDKLLIEHRLDRPPETRFDLPAGTTVIVDETAMVATPRLAELIDLAQQQGWRLALIGDPMQFAAVGRSGMFGHLVDTHGAIELDRVHRFTASWERDASLRLRRGDTDVVALYDRHDRFHGGTGRQMAKATVAAWRHAILNGETAAMMAPTRAGVDVLNELAQYEGIAAGEIDLRSRSVKVDTGRAHAGDLVATRRNDRALLTDQGRMVKNRDRWTVEAVHDDGRLTVTGRTGSVTLPADYVATYVELAYAETSHATQGRTVDRSFLFLDGPTDTRGIYVPLTRGRTTNEAFVVLHDERSPAEVVADAVARTWIDRPATAQRLDQVAAPEQVRPHRPLSVPDLRRLVEQVTAARMEVARLGYQVADLGRTGAHLLEEREATEAAISAAEQRLAMARTVVAEHDRPLHRRGHRTQINQAHRDLVDLPEHINRLRLQSKDLEVEVDQNDQRLATSRHDWTCAEAVAADLGRRLDDDAELRGKAVAETGSAATALLGSVPDASDVRALWVHAAGRATQHRALWPIPDDQLLGPKPRPVGPEDYAITFHRVAQAVTDLERDGSIQIIDRSDGALSR